MTEAERRKQFYSKQRSDAESQADAGSENATMTANKIRSKTGRPQRQAGTNDPEFFNKVGLGLVGPEALAEGAATDAAMYGAKKLLGPAAKAVGGAVKGGLEKMGSAMRGGEKASRSAGKVTKMSESATKASGRTVKMSKSGKAKANNSPEKKYAKSVGAKSSPSHNNHAYRDGPDVEHDHESGPTSYPRQESYTSIRKAGSKVESRIPGKGVKNITPGKSKSGPPAKNGVPSGKAIKGTTARKPNDAPGRPSKYSSPQKARAVAKGKATRAGKGKGTDGVLRGFNRDPKTRVSLNEASGSKKTAESLFPGMRRDAKKIGSKKEQIGKVQKTRIKPSENAYDPKKATPKKKK